MRGKKPRSAQGQSAPQPAGDDDDDVLLIEPAEEVQRKPNGRKRTAESQPTIPAPRQQRVKVEDERKELEDLRQQYHNVVAERDTLKDQLDEIFHLRNTEPEESLEQMRNQYEIRLSTQEEMIQELTSQISRLDSLAQAGKTSTLHFLTEEAAAEKRRGLDQEIERLKAALKEKDKVIAGQKTELSEQDSTIRTLRADLKTEIENSKTLMARTRGEPPSASRGRKVPPLSKVDDLKNGKAIRLYEDLTNFLVINVRVSEDNETVYHCVFTHPASMKGLNFTLRVYEEGKKDEPNDNEKESLNVMYSPLDLDKEDQEFKESLDYLAEPFSFHYDQLPLFLKNIAEAMDALCSPDEEGEEEDL